ncbi:MAG: DnaD domain protein [Lachnospirales bacterium]
MKNLHITKELKPGKLHDFLIDKISNFPPVYVVLYLHFNALAKKDTVVDICDIAKKFNIVLTDVLLALENFKERDMLFLKKDGDDLYISFSEEVQIDNSISKKIENGCSNYSPLELEELIENSIELKEFYQKAQESFSYSFTYADYERLLACHDLYILPLEVILSAVEYCKLEDKLSMGYLESICKKLNIEEAFTLELAQKVLKLSGDRYTEILETLGIKGTLKPVQKTLIDTWFDDLKYPIQIILEACDKAVLSTNNPNLNYVNGILKNWKDAGVSTISEISEYEKSYSKSNNIKRKSNTKNEKSSNNFEGKSINYNEIEKLENTYL